MKIFACSPFFSQKKPLFLWHSEGGKDVVGIFPTFPYFFPLDRVEKLKRCLSACQNESYCDFFCHESGLQMRYFPFFFLDMKISKPLTPEKDFIACKIYALRVEHPATGRKNPSLFPHLQIALIFVHAKAFLKKATGAAAVG